MDCHEDEAAALKAGSHQAILDSAILLGCETCHGPGTSHADDEDNDPALITHPDKLDSASRQRLCSQCHTDQIRYHGGDMAGFLAAGKKCTTCHKIHKKTVPPSQPGTLFQTRVAANQTAEPVGAQKCLTCHPLRDRLLTASAHHTMAAAKDPQGCETCHGNGSLHVETGGLSRLISRPDTAQDQIATCRSCHQQVDAELFHWTDGHNPLLTAGITCTTCHQVHQTQTIKAASIPLTMVQPPDSELVSNETCAKCHEPAFGVLDGTIHESLGRRDIPLSQGCGGCHPGSLNHARQGGHKDLVESLRNSDANTQAKTCAQCHSADSAMHRSRSGAHHKAQVTCLTCHSPAAPKHRVREDASSKCAECHKQVEAEFKLPNHHPVLEGAMGCVDCHDPHSARPRMRNRELRSQSCVKCHKQYRGPFVFAHQASRTDGCVACHSPHGSVNKMLLKQPTSQQNCLQCHSDFPAFHDQTTGAVFTNCMKCHTEVHGSNHSRYLFR
jgi:DmsE family decaheme c-type cytochrome